MKAISLLLLLAACATHEPDTSPTAKFNRQLQQCYEESDSINETPPISGSMTYRLDVKKDGTVKAADILKSDFKKDRNFEACITGQMKRGIVATVPGHKADVEEYIIPVNFKPVKR
jgi:hypothetical protein